MQTLSVGILHPGEMGVSIAGSAKNGGNTVYWVSEGRSQQTRERAAKVGLQDAKTLAHLCATCSIILSVCPPESAGDVANQVAALRFKGIYVDANAVSPGHALAIGEMMTQAGASFVDGGIIGGPAWERGKTWLYLSGPRASEVAAIFSAGPLETSVLGESIGTASALKICNAAYTKGTTALLCATLATAENLGVLAALKEQWARDGAGMFDQAAQRVRRVTAKAWRFGAEMDEIADTFAAAGLPPDFFTGAGILYRRLAHFKNAASTPALEDVLAALISGKPNSG